MRVYKEGDRVVRIFSPNKDYWGVKIYEARPRKRGRGLLWKLVGGFRRWGNWASALADAKWTGLPYKGDVRHHQPAPTKESIVLDVLQNKGT